MGARDKVAVLQALKHSPNIQIIECAAGKVANNRDRRRLRARSEGPRRRRPPEKRNELASLHGRPQTLKARHRTGSSMDIGRPRRYPLWVNRAGSATKSLQHYAQQ